MTCGCPANSALMLGWSIADNRNVFQRVVPSGFKARLSRKAALLVVVGLPIESLQHPLAVYDALLTEFA